MTHKSDSSPGQRHWPPGRVTTECSLLLDGDPKKLERHAVRVAGRVERAKGDIEGIARRDLVFPALHAHDALAPDKIIDFLSVRVGVPLGLAARVDNGVARMQDPALGILGQYEVEHITPDLVAPLAQQRCKAAGAGLHRYF